MILISILLAAAAATQTEGAPTASPKPVDTAWSILQDALKGKAADKRAIAVHSLGITGGNRKAEELAENALVDSNPLVRVEAANALGQMKAERARVKLKAALDDKEIKVVVAAANALYEFKDPEAFEIYYALLTGTRKSKEGLVQSQLDTLHDIKAVEKLAFEAGIGFIPYGGMGLEAWRAVMHDDAAAVQAAAALKLANDPDPRSLKALEGAAAQNKWQVRAAAAMALAKRGDPRLSETVAALLVDENFTVRCTAAAALIRLNEGGQRQRARDQATRK
jgi:HEAT repeat protein